MEKHDLMIPCFIFLKSIGAQKNYEKFSVWVIDLHLRDAKYDILDHDHEVDVQASRQEVFAYLIVQRNGNMRGRAQVFDLLG